MALDPIDEAHALQIQAGTIGRKAGHAFEDTITQKINSLTYPFRPHQLDDCNVHTGDPSLLLLSAIAANEKVTQINRAIALSTGALATSEDGKKWLQINGVAVNRCKSDLVLTLDSDDGRVLTIGISTKQCNNANPTNAQLYFTTASGFATLLQGNNIPVSARAVLALKQFCGDVGYRPSDGQVSLVGRLFDPRRYFWEEIDPTGRLEWENIFRSKQDEITRLLLQKAYLNDPFIPTYVLHKTRKSATWEATEVSIYQIEKLIALSAKYQGFATKAYAVKKGSYKDPVGASHLAPRFGIVQMQRGGQAQHPTQLQFNLEAGYFYKI